MKKDNKKDNLDTTPIGHLKAGDITYTPKPMNRGIIIDNPMSRIPKSAIELTPELEEERKEKVLKELFPEGVVMHNVLYVDESLKEVVKPGDLVTLNNSALMRAVGLGKDMIYINAGDIITVWEANPITETSTILHA